MSRPIAACGVLILVTLAAASRLDARADVSAFLGLFGIASASYLAALVAIARGRTGSSRVLAGCLLLAVVWRLPLLAAAPLVSDDVYRYLWDGRVQRLGHSPYVTVPNDPALAPLHTPMTAQIDPTSAELPTIYPPAAQLFFRAVAAIHESVGMMVAAVVVCDLLTALVLWRWLRRQGRDQWWVLAYAWHPLVALEGAGGAHIDILGTLLLVVAIYCLSTVRSLSAAVCMGLSFSVKFLPVVLVPLFWRRVKLRDLVVGVTAVVLLYLPFADGWRPPIGSLLTYAQQWRFNGPFFGWGETLVGTGGAVVVAIGAGLLVATVSRLRLGRDAPEAWAWPMAATLALMPAVYPWYLVWLTPFLTTRATWPLLAWTLTAPLTYVVWESELAGTGWVLPGWVEPLEYGVVIAVAAALWIRPHGRIPAG